jgi:membrane protein required for beta-lactamase induction
MERAVTFSLGLIIFIGWAILDDRHDMGARALVAAMVVTGFGIGFVFVDIIQPSAPSLGLALLVVLLLVGPSAIRQAHPAYLTGARR